MIIAGLCIGTRTCTCHSSMPVGRRHHVLLVEIVERKRKASKNRAIGSNGGAQYLTKKLEMEREHEP